jgi:hypothetical protein
MQHYPDVNEYFGYLDPPFVQYLPNHWVTEFLYWSVNGDMARAIPYFTLLFHHDAWPDSRCQHHGEEGTTTGPGWPRTDAETMKGPTDVLPAEHHGVYVRPGG